VDHRPAPLLAGLDVATAAEWPELAEAIPQFNPDYLALLSKADTGQRQATVEFSFTAGGRPAGAAHQARGWWVATMVAFVMAAFCCASRLSQFSGLWIASVSSRSSAVATGYGNRECIYQGK
jgi:hypothetical protein